MRFMIVAAGAESHMYQLPDPQTRNLAIFLTVLMGLLICEVEAAWLLCMQLHCASDLTQPYISYILYNIIVDICIIFSRYDASRPVYLYANYAECMCTTSTHACHVSGVNISSQNQEAVGSLFLETADQHTASLQARWTHSMMLPQQGQLCLSTLSSQLSTPDSQLSFPEQVLSSCCSALHGLHSIQLCLYPSRQLCML